MFPFGSFGPIKGLMRERLRHVAQPSWTQHMDDLIGITMGLISGPCPYTRGVLRAQGLRDCALRLG